MFMTPLHALDLPRKLLLTSILIMLAIGFIISEGFVFQRLTTGGGKPGLLGNIAATFHGDRSMTPLKREILGPMKRYFSAFEDAGKITPEEQADLERVLVWSDAGAPESEFLDAGEGQTPVYSVLERHGCFNCHAASATVIGNRKDSPLTTYAGLARFTKPEQGIEPGRLLMLSHVHLFGLAFIFLLTGFAVAATLWPLWLRCALITGGPLAAVLTMASWWAVKYTGPPWAPLVLAGGILTTLAFALSTLAALYDLWLRRLTIGD